MLQNAICRNPGVDHGATATKPLTLCDHTQVNRTAQKSRIISHPINVPNMLISNIRSLARKIDEVGSIASSNHVDMICITETWLSPSIPDNLVSLPNFNLFRNDRSVSSGGGVCAYISSNIHSRRLPQYECPSIESMVVSKTKKVTSLNFCYFIGCRVPFYSITPN